MSDKSELLPCPFCGGTDLDKTQWVECIDCGMIGPHVDGLSAAEAWNRRGASPAPAAQEPKCRTCKDVGIIGHSTVCPECADTWQPKQSAAAPAAEQPDTVPVPNELLGRVLYRLEHGGLDKHHTEGHELRALREAV